MGRKASRRRERRTADLASPETAWAEALAGQILGFHKKSLPKQWFLVKPDILAMMSALVFKVAD